jgi:hypothetical protein
MVRIITWLDPHNVDVYKTGAWHLDYNFTDFGQRSDRRYIPVAVALLQEGIENNPDVPDLYSDLAFTHYSRKMADFPDSVHWYQQAERVPNWDVTIVGHGLAHAYQGAGEIPQEIAQWKYCVAQHQYRINHDTDPTVKGTEEYSLKVAQKNLDETEARYKWRQIQTKPPIDVNFSGTLTRIAPMVFVVSGKMSMVGSQPKIGSKPGYNLETGKASWGPADGARVDVRLQDSTYQMPRTATFGLSNNVPVNTTIMQDSITVRNGVFQKQIDMSKDHVGTDPMYSFAAPTYTVTLWFNPSNIQSNPPNIADRIGWLGEGMTDKKYLDTSGNVPATPGTHIPGLRMIKKTFTLTREDILGDGLKTFN